MKIAIIGAGNVGGTLAKKFKKAGHTVIIGARNPESPKIKNLTEAAGDFTVKTIKEAAAEAEVILISASANAVKEICGHLGDVSGKIIIDAMNAVSFKPEPYDNTFDAIKGWTNCRDIAKCFNTTGFENMEDTDYGSTSADMFTAGSSKRAKEAAILLSKDAGFGECYDFGDDDRATLLEDLALCWINLAIFQKHGRNIAFKVLKRET